MAAAAACDSGRHYAWSSDEASRHAAAAGVCAWASAGALGERGLRACPRDDEEPVFLHSIFVRLLLLGAMVWMVVFFLAPLAGLGWWFTILPALMTLCSVAAAYRVMGETSQIDARYGWLYPLGALVFLLGDAGVNGDYMATRRRGSGEARIMLCAICAVTTASSHGSVWAQEERLADRLRKEM